MKVLKFGGTSVGTVESLKNLKAIVDVLEEPAVVVVSALGGLTDQLIATANLAVKRDETYKDNIKGMSKRHHDIIEQMVPETKKNDVLQTVNPLLKELEEIYTGVYYLQDLSEKTLNRIVSFGERMSSYIVANILKNAQHKDSLEFIKTEKWFDDNISSRQVTDGLIREKFVKPLSSTTVVGGFIAKDRDTEEITNLGRGGSDYTAALIAAALDADILEIWTDVDGFMTADPRLIPEAQVINNMTFIESMELCSFGAKVIYPPTIYPVFHKNIPIKILNTHNPKAPGTLITDNAANLPADVRGVSSIKNTAIINLSGDLTSNIAEINSRTYNAMARNGINISLVGQPSDEAVFSMTVKSSDVNKAVEILKKEFAPELQNGDIKGIEVIKGLSVIAVVRESIKKLKGLGARLINTLNRDNIPVKAISDGPSETTIAIVVEEENTEKALKLIHAACFRK